MSSDGGIIKTIVIERETLEEGLQALSELLVSRVFEHSKAVFVHESRVFLDDLEDTTAEKLIQEALTVREGIRS
jgi:hypothetical protein